MTDMYQYEQDLIDNGYTLIGGIDEAGRGPLAGPLVVALCVLPINYRMSEINDSKKLSAKKRNELFDIIIRDALYYQIKEVSVDEVDNFNIYQATKLAMIELSNNSNCDYILTDAMPLDEGIKHTSIIKGDQKSMTIAAASILAKVTRDRIMEEQDVLYPDYGFKNHKGYGTKKHLEALKTFGVTPIHRKTYKPVTDLLNIKEN